VAAFGGVVRAQREALIRRDEVLRDATRWDARGRPDHLLPHPELVAEVRSRLAAAGLWEDLRREGRVAYFLAQDDLEQDEAIAWHRRRPAIGGLMAVLGDERPGVGLRPDGLPDIDWIAIRLPDAKEQDAASAAIGRARQIARCPVTNTQYLAFTSADDYTDTHWWQEG